MSNHILPYRECGGAPLPSLAEQTAAWGVPHPRGNQREHSRKLRMKVLRQHKGQSRLQPANVTVHSLHAQGRPSSPGGQH